MLTITDLDQHKHFGLEAGYAGNSRRFYSPWDGVHEVLVAVLSSVRTSLVMSMYGWTDTELAGLVRQHLTNPDVYTQITLDSSQFGGKTEHQVLADLVHDAPGNSVAVGRSERGEIVHRKMLIVDGVWLVTGSTNWSLNGEQKQDNELTVTYDPVACAEARHILDLSHTKALKDMAARKAA